MTTKKDKQKKLNNQLKKPDVEEKGITKRASHPTPALVPSLNLKTRCELIDYDYLDKLSPEELQWLNSFSEEYTNANFNHKGKRIHKKIIVKSKKRKNKKVDKFKNKSETANNKRNVDIYTRQRAAHCLDYFSEFDEGDEPVFEFWEDMIIYQLDNSLTKKLKKSNNNTSSTKKSTDDVSSTSDEV